MQTWNKAILRPHLYAVLKETMGVNPTAEIAALKVVLGNCHSRSLAGLRVRSLLS